MALYNDQRRHERWLDRFYPVPRGWWMTEGDCYRFYGRDATAMTPEQIRREHQRLRFRLALDDQPDPWLVARRRVLEQAAR